MVSQKPEANQLLSMTIKTLRALSLLELRRHEAVAPTIFRIVGGTFSWLGINTNEDVGVFEICFDTLCFSIFIFNFSEKKLHVFNFYFRFSERKVNLHVFMSNRNMCLFQAWLLVPRFVTPGIRCPAVTDCILVAFTWMYSTFVHIQIR